MFYHSQSQKSNIGLTGLKSKFGRTLYLLLVLGEDSFSTFSSLWRPVSFLGSWLSHSNLCFGYMSTLTLSPSLLLFIRTLVITDPCDYIRTTQIIRDYFYHSKNLNLTTPIKSLLPCNTIRMQISLGAVNLPTMNCLGQWDISKSCTNCG